MHMRMRAFGVRFVLRRGLKMFFKKISFIGLLYGGCFTIFAEVKLRMRNPSEITILVGVLPGFAMRGPLDLSQMTNDVVRDTQELPSQVQTDAEFAPSAEVYITTEDVVVMRQVPLGIAGRESAAHNYDSAPYKPFVSAKEFFNNPAIGAFKIVAMREDLGKGYVSVVKSGNDLIVQTNPTIQDIQPELVVASIPIKR
jgi:hypothetical protein